MGNAATSFPKDKIKVLLLENVHQSAHEIFAHERFQVEAIKHALKEDELATQDPRRAHPRDSQQDTGHRARAARGQATARRRLLLHRHQPGGRSTPPTGMGVPVFNAPFSNTRSVAELVIGEIIALSRQLGDRSREVHEGVWKKGAVGVYEVRGKMLGIVGYGHIGRQLGVLAEALGMRVVFYDHNSKLPMGNNRAITLDELLAQSDFVSLHVPETPQTKKMIGAAEIAKMKKGSHLLNASRGTVVDIPALAAALTQRSPGRRCDRRLSRRAGVERGSASRASSRGCPT